MRAGNASSFAWIYLHQCGRFNNATNLYNFRNRDYSLWLGQWVQKDSIGYSASDHNLLRYLHNNPIHLVDPSGEAPRLSYKNVGKVVSGECGSAIWGINWQLSEKTDKGGYVVQDIVSIVDIRDCNGKRLDDLIKKFTGRSPNPKGEFWERWKSEAQKLTTGEDEDDIYRTPSVGKCTKGSIQIRGIAAFYENLKLFPDDFELLNPQTDAAGAESTINKPNLPAATSNIIQHNIIITWNCCPEGHVEDSVVGVFFG